MWALWDGLRLCVEKKIHVVEVELDARVVGDWMADRTRDNIDYSILISDYKYLMNLISTMVVKHCYREANQWTDKLARLGGTQQLEFSIFECPHVDTRLILYYNAIGMYHERLCLSSISWFLIYPSINPEFLDFVIGLSYSFLYISLLKSKLFPLKKHKLFVGDSLSQLCFYH